MKKKILLIMFFSILLTAVSGCSMNNSTVVEIKFDFDANYYESTIGKTNKLLTEDPEIFIIHTKDELNEYYENNKELYDLSEFYDHFDQYDDAYFNRQDLVLIVFQEPSAAIAHGISSVDYVDDTWEITIQRDLPEMGTANIAWWHIALEIPDVKLDSDEYTDNIKINVIDKATTK